jgi:hypothetical protein
MILDPKGVLLDNLKCRDLSYVPSALEKVSGRILPNKNVTFFN